MVTLNILLKQAAAGKIFDQLQAQRLVIGQSPAYGGLGLALRIVGQKAMSSAWFGDAQLRQTGKNLLLPLLQPLHALGILQFPVRPTPFQ
jgi:hypothetical protein